jgi:hypothetical protein
MIYDKPNNLADAVAVLRCLLRPEELAAVKASRPEDLARFHFNHGEYVRNLWVHRGGSPLTERIEAAGGTIGTGDDFSQLVLEALWYDLNEQPYDVRRSPHFKRILHAGCDQHLAKELWPR